MAPQRVAVPTKFAAIVASVLKERGVTVEEGWGKGNVVLKAAGKIFAILSGGRLVVKLPKARVDAIVDAGGGERFDPRKDGRVMKEWLVAGKALRASALVREAHAFVGGGVRSAHADLGRPPRRHSALRPPRRK
jgi:hypothetical protein